MDFAKSQEKWKRHFSSMTHNHQQNTKRFYTLNKSRQLGGNSAPVIRLITPTQQAVEMAKSEVREGLKRKTQESLNTRKRQKLANRRQYHHNNGRRENQRLTRIKWKKPAVKKEKKRRV